MLKIMPRSLGSGVTSDGEASSKARAKEGSASLQCPLLTSSNYMAWSMKMRVYMEVQVIWEWDAVEDASGEVDNRHDKMTLAAIYQGVSEEKLLLLTDKKTANEAWSVLKSMYVWGPTE